MPIETCAASSRRPQVRNSSSQCRRVSGTRLEQPGPAERTRQAAQAGQHQAQRGVAGQDLQALARAEDRRVGVEVAGGALVPGSTALLLPRHTCTRRAPTGLCGSQTSYAWQCIVLAAADVEEQVQRPADGQRRRQLHHAHDPGLLPVLHQLVRRRRHKHLRRQHFPAVSKRWGQKSSTGVTGRH